MIDYTSLERDDLMIYAEGDGQLDYVQREVYAGSERIEQFIIIQHKKPDHYSIHGKML